MIVTSKLKIIPIRQHIHKDVNNMHSSNLEGDNDDVFSSKENPLWFIFLDCLEYSQK